MKIKLIASANIELSKQLSELNMQYGITSYSETESTSKITTNKNSFGMKVLARLDKWLNGKKILINEEKEIIDSIARSVNYLNENLGEEALNSMHVQINMPSLSHTAYTKFIDKFSPYSKQSKDSVSQYTAHINTYKTLNPNISLLKKYSFFIVLGMESLKTVFNDIKSVVKTETISQFTLFHEVSHGLQRLNKSKYIENDSNMNTYLKQMEMFQINKINNPINEKLKTNHLHQLHQINGDVFKSLATLQGEMYADVSAILHMRNYQLSTDAYNMKNFTDFSKQMVWQRRLNMSNMKNYLDKDVVQTENKNINDVNEMINIISSTEHFTSFSLMDMDVLLENLGNKYLNEKEIHNITNDQMQKGIARFICVVLDASPMISEQFKTFSMLGKDLKTNEYELRDGNKNEEYEIFKTAMEATAGNKGGIPWNKIVKNGVEIAKVVESKDIFGTILLTTLENVENQRVISPNSLSKEQCMKNIIEVQKVINKLPNEIELIKNNILHNIQEWKKDITENSINVSILNSEKPPHLKIRQ